MKVYAIARKTPSVFLSLTGIKRSEFDRLVLEFDKEIKISIKGRKHTLYEVEYCLFFMLFYYRHYCTQQLMAFVFRVDQSQISRWIKHLELPFERCTKQYIDKARRRISNLAQLRKYNPKLDVIIDCSERPVLTHANSKDLFSGKKNFCTVKNMVGANRITKEVVYVSKTVKGARHDFHRFKQFKDEIPSDWNLVMDLGFIGADNIVTNRCFLPIKAKSELNENEVEFNKILSSQRCRGEHVFAQMKHFKILSDEFRGSSRLCDSSFKAIAGLYNFRRQIRKDFKYISIYLILLFFLSLFRIKF